MLMRTTSIIFFLAWIATVFAQQQQCQGIEVLYPKADSIIAQTKEQASTYLILGNTNDDNNKPKLTKVSLIHLDDKNQEVVQDVWTGQDEILRVSAIQQDLKKLKTRDLPNTFWFRIFTQLDDSQCQYESGKFKITTNI
ncbi:unnamed protein product [Mucor circinelloides]|uniref:Uncharacterized protein n=1 Tax=Mucor circinelloides f. circinelloides (strain 1006PhL) TaxID=1220926 RepID=S2K3B7_MUCC1|nr:hypothetical protein HMPREF1544_06496 [Mucor circinelloides 1006PhL]